MQIIKLVSVGFNGDTQHQGEVGIRKNLQIKWNAYGEPTTEGE